MKPNTRFGAMVATVFGVVVSVFSIALAQPEEALSPCLLYTQAEAQDLFKEKVTPGVVRKTSLPAGEVCRYTFSKNGGVYGVKVRVSTTREIREEGINNSAEDVFNRQTRARKSSEYSAKKFKAVQGLGDGAFWEGTGLWVLSGKVLIIITVDSVLEGSFSNREALDAALSEQNFNLSRKVAGTVLSKLD